MSSDDFEDERSLRVVDPDDDLDELVENMQIVHAPGSKVALLPGNEYLSATILAVQIRENGYVLYNVAFWGGNGRTEEWVTAAEVHSIDNAVKMAIGFEPREAKPT